MKNLYIDGHLLIKTAERVVFNNIVYYASEPQNIHRRITTDEEGIYVVTDNSFSDSVFLNVYVKGGVTFYENGPYCLFIPLHPRLKSELEEINNKVLDKLKADLSVHRLILMGYFAQFELYLMEMAMLFVMFDEEHIRIFIKHLREDKKLRTRIKKKTLDEISDMLITSSWFDIAMKLKSLIAEMFVFHRFDNIEYFFKSIYNIQVPSFETMKRLYKDYRNDLIHRNGRNTNDSIVYISRSLVNEVYKEMVEYSVKFDAIKNHELQLEE